MKYNPTRFSPLNHEVLLNHTLKFNSHLKVTTFRINHEDKPVNDGVHKISGAMLSLRLNSYRGGKYVCILSKELSSRHPSDV